MSEAVLTPPKARPHGWVVRLPQAWYVACASHELRHKPLARTTLGIPMVLFRDGTGRAAALLDRCPHRNAPLSAGRVVQGQVQCPYHGWRFGGDGACVAVPGLVGEVGSPGRCATAYPVCEQDGLVWVWCDETAAPQGLPLRVPHAEDPEYAVFRLEMRLEGSLILALENMLDVPHTAFLHAGLFRSSQKRNTITARVRRHAGGVECEYVGEPRPTGLIGALLEPGGGVVQHWDRFLMPCVGQVEYRLGDRSHILSTQAMTPETDHVTRTYAVAAFKLPIPGFLLKPFVKPLVRKILQQDAWMLKRITGNVERFGGERFTSTPIDLLGPHIYYLLRGAERGELDDREHVALEREVRLQV